MTEEGTLKADRLIINLKNFYEKLLYDNARCWQSI